MAVEAVEYAGEGGVALGVSSETECNPMLMSMRMRSSYVSCCVKGRGEVAKRGEIAMY